MEPYSIYARRLAMKGDLITHNKDKAVLTLMKLNKVIETDLQTISIEATLGDLVKKVSRSSRNIFPVIDENEALLGIVLLDDIRKIMFNQDLYNVTFVRDFMTTPPTIVDVTDSMDLVMKKFEDTGAWNLPVIEEGRYIGFVSKQRYSTLTEGCFNIFPTNNRIIWISIQKLGYREGLVSVISESTLVCFKILCRYCIGLACFDCRCLAYPFGFPDFFGRNSWN